MWSSFLLDLRIAVRRLLGRRGATLLAVVTLSVGIGAVSTMYALFSAGMDDLPPVPGADRIARVYIVNRSAPEGRLQPSAAEWKAWADAPPPGVTLALAEVIDASVDAGYPVSPAESSDTADELRRASPLLFGIVGLHAAIVQALTARTRETGIRIALGASARDVIASTIGHHAAPAVIGIVLGFGISVAGLALLSTDDASMIRERAMTAALSPRWWIVLTGLLVVAALTSAAMPVLRALRLSPADVLRQE